MWYALPPWRFLPSHGQTGSYTPKQILSHVVPKSAWRKFRRIGNDKPPCRRHLEATEATDSSVIPIFGGGTTMLSALKAD
jgi:hypothetical protein